MYAQRYQPRRVNRGSLGLSVGIVAPLLAAAMLASPTIRHKITDPPLTIYPVPPPAPPPKPEPQLQPRTKAHPATPIDLPQPQVLTDPRAPFTPPPQPPPPDPGTLTAGDAGPVAVEPVKPPPLLIQASVDERYQREFQPLYPPAEQRAGRDGVVVLKVLVGVDGRVRDAQPLSATSDEFWRVTQKQALARWRFRPATRDGIPVEAWKTMTVRFHLEDAG